MLEDGSSRERTAQSFEAAFAVSQGYEERQDFARARYLLEQALELSRDDLAASRLLGEVCYELVLYPAAVDSYTRALEMEPTNKSIRGRFESVSAE